MHAEMSNALLGGSISLARNRVIRWPLGDRPNGARAGQRPFLPDSGGLLSCPAALTDIAADIGRGNASEITVGDGEVGVPKLLLDDRSRDPL